MAGLFFESDVDQWNQEAIAARDRVNPAKEGVLSTVGKGLARGFIKLNKGFAIAAHGIIPQLPGEEEEWQQTFEGYDKALKATTPDPSSTGTASKILGAISELPTQLVGGPYLMLNSVAMNTGADLVEQGVDPTTATFAAVGSAATTGAMFKLPQVGRNLWETAALTTANPLIGAANDLALKTGLEARGYKEQAAGINPLDPASRLTDLTLGGIFGALGYHGMRSEQKAHATALEAAGAKVEHYQELVKKIGGDSALRERLPVEAVDSLDTMDNYSSILAKNPFNRAAIDGVDRHIAMLNTALKHIQQGKPVEVADFTTDLHKPTPRTVEFQDFMDKWGARFGLDPEQQAAQEAIVQARAKVMGLTPDEFADRYFADVTNQHPEAGAFYQQGSKLAFAEPLADVQDIPKNREYRITAEQAQQIADQYGNGTISRVTDRQYFETGIDHGNPDYGHRFVSNNNQPVRGLTSFALNGERDILHTKLDGQPGNDAMIHYSVRPADIGGEFVVVRKQDADGKPVFHLYADKPVNTDTATVQSHGLALKAKAEEIAKTREVQQNGFDLADEEALYSDERAAQIYESFGVELSLQPDGGNLQGDGSQQRGDGKGNARTEKNGSENGSTADNTGNTNTLYQSGPLAKPFYSALLRSVETLKQEKWNGDQLLNTLRKTPGIKPEEITWTGLDEFLAGKKSVTRENVWSYLSDNQVRVQEVTKAEGSTKYDTYTTPGGENYRELLLTLPTKESANVARRAELAEFDRQRPLTPAEQAEFDSLKGYAAGGNTYRSSHFDEPNVLAHIRFNERTGPEGERILHVEEVQSDWHQARRDGKQVPDAPFVKTWHELALRRMLRYAAEENFDRLTWTTGEQQADRYDLSKKMKEVRFSEYDGLYDITGRDINGEQHGFGKFTEKQLPDAVGKELANKILNARQAGERSGILSGVDLKAGGEGMKGFYDKILPDFLNRFGKKFDAKVSDIATEDGTFHSIPVTDAMRSSLLHEGQPLFQDAKAAVTFLDDGRAVIHALQNPDVTSAMHELAHIFRRTLDRHEQADFTRWLMNEVPGTKWERSHEEVFARAFEKYLSDGQAPTKELQPFFEKFKNWFLEIYRNIVDSPLELRLHPKAKEAFDQMLYREQLNRKASPEVVELQRAVASHAAEVNADLHELAGLPQPDHISDAGKMVEQPKQQTPPRVMRDIAHQLYDDPDLIKRFTQEPTKVSSVLADMFEEQAGLLEKSTAEHFTTMNEHGESVRMNRQWSDAPEWFLAHNRHLKRNKKNDGIAKNSVVSALRKAAAGKFDKLTAGQQDMVLSALDAINHQLQAAGRDYDAFELQVGDRYTAPDLGMRTVVAERDGKLVLDNHEMIDKQAIVRVLGEVDTTGRPPQAGYDPLDFQVQTLIKERGDFNVFAGTDEAGQPVWLPASEYIDRVKNEAAAHENRKHLYDRAAACMSMEI